MAKWADFCSSSKYNTNDVRITKSKKRRALTIWGYFSNHLFYLFSTNPFFLSLKSFAIDQIFYPNELYVGIKIIFRRKNKRANFYICSFKFRARCELNYFIKRSLVVIFHLRWHVFRDHPSLFRSRLVPKVMKSSQVKALFSFIRIQKWVPKAAKYIHMEKFKSASWHFSLTWLYNYF